MLQEEGVYCCEDAARTAFVLINTVSHLLIEIETLLPTIMECCSRIAEKKLLNGRGFTG